MLLATSQEDRTKTQKKILIHCDLWREFLVRSFLYILTALNMILTCNFAMLKNTQSTKYGINIIYNWSRGAHKNNLEVWVTMTENCWKFISCYFTQLLNKFIKIYKQRTRQSIIGQICSILHRALSKCLWIFSSNFLN